MFCHDGNGRYLIAKRSQNCRDEQGRWEPGGGGVKFGESIEDALRREIREEFLTEPEETMFLGFRDVHREQGGQLTHWVHLDFLVRVKPDAVKIGEPHKCDGIEWVTLSELSEYPEPLHSQFEPFLERWNERLI